MSFRSGRLLWIAAVAAGCQGNVNNGWSVPTYTIRVSVGPEGEANNHSSTPSISGNGRYVVFATNATTLVPGGVVSGDYSQIYLSDVDAGTLTLITTASNGTGEGAGNSINPSISADGNYVAFQSKATNLIGVAISAAFYQVYVFSLRDPPKRLLISDATTGGTQGANGDSERPSLSEDGSIVAFQSSAGDLHPDVSASNGDVYWRKIDMTTPAVVGPPLHVSQNKDLGPPTTGGGGAATSTSPSLSWNGARVAFLSNAQDLVGSPDMTGNTITHVFVRDIDVGTSALGTTSLVSVNTSGGPGTLGSDGVAISGAGAFVVFSSDAEDLVDGGDTNATTDIFLRDLGAGSTVRISNNMGTGAQGSKASTQPAISADGRYVVFRSDSANLVAGDVNGMADVFLHDRLLGITRRVSLSTYGVEASSVVPSGETAGQHQPALNADGRFVAYISSAPNLVVGDGNDKDDVFVSGPLYGE